jgi:soluble lytic murein transglycosylase-like protein
MDGGGRPEDDVRLPRSTTALVSLLALGWTGSAAYVVQPGDTLSGIARRLGVPMAELQEANGITDPDRIIAGRELRLPARPDYPERLAAAPERLALVPYFERWAAANELPVDLLMAVTWLESGWQNDVVSSKGALGIGQLMPGTVDFTRRVLIGVPTLDPNVPEHNIRMSARFLDWLLHQTGGDVAQAVAGYYQGLRSVREQGPKPETVAYVANVLALRGRFVA